MKRSLAVLVFVLLLGSSAIGALISVDAMANTAADSSTLTIALDASGSDKLVVIATGEHGFNQTANGQVNDITYDGVSLTKLVDRNPIHYDAGPPEVLVDDTANDIWYMDNPGAVHTTGTISASMTTRGSLTVLALSGTAPGAGNWVIGPRDSSYANLTTSAGSIVIASYGMGGSGNTAFTDSVTPDGPLTLAVQQHNGGGRYWDGHVVAYANGVTAGTAIYSFTDPQIPGADGRTGAHVIAAEFLAIPEPAALSLLGLGVVGALAARRRKRGISKRGRHSRDDALPVPTRFSARGLRLA